MPSRFLLRLILAVALAPSTNCATGKSRATSETGTSDLEVGLREIDEQHRALLEHVARLKDAVRRESRDEIASLFEFLAGYASNHFQTEERAMTERGYSGLGQHRELHKKFVESFLARKAAYEAQGPTLALGTELCGWLAEWLNEHVRGADAEMGQFLRTHPSTASVSR